MTYDKKLNYCTFSPDQLFGVRFNYACYLHDRQYRNEVKVRKTRKESDIVLRDIIIKEYSKAGKKWLGIIIGNIYYIVVRMFNKKFWVKGGETNVKKI